MKWVFNAACQEKWIWAVRKITEDAVEIENKTDLGLTQPRTEQLGAVTNKILHSLLAEYII